LNDRSVRPAVGRGGRLAAGGWSAPIDEFVERVFQTPTRAPVTVPQLAEEPVTGMAGCIPPWPLTVARQRGSC